MSIVQVIDHVVRSDHRHHDQYAQLAKLFGIIAKNDNKELSVETCIYSKVAIREALWQQSTLGTVGYNLVSAHKRQ